MSEPISAPPNDEPPHPGWWKASDGQWYPPQGSVQPPPGKKKGGCLKWIGIAVAALVLLVLVAALAGGGDDGEDSDDPGQAAGSQSLFDRPDEKKNDKESENGGTLQLSGYTVTVKGEFTQQVSEFETKGYLVASVTLENRDDEAQSYNPYYFKLITPAGTIIDPTITTGDRLSSGDLTTGGKITGAIPWEVGGTKGDYYVIFDPPDLADDSRGVWKVVLS